MHTLYWYLISHFSQLQKIKDPQIKIFVKFMHAKFNTHKENAIYLQLRATTYVPLSQSSQSSKKQTKHQYAIRMMTSFYYYM